MVAVRRKATARRLRGFSKREEEEEERRRGGDRQVSIECFEGMAPERGFVLHRIAALLWGTLMP